MRRDPPLLEWRGVVAPFLVSRALSALVLLVGYSWPFADGISLDGFARWDGGYYLAIAADGYGPAPVAGEFSRWPFFPLFPGVLRAFDVIGVSPKLGGVLVNEAVFLVALAGLYRLASRHTTVPAARLGVWAIALFPSSFVFSMLYPSGLVLLASVWAFLLVEDRHDLAAGLVVLVATGARPNGIVVAVAVAVAARHAGRMAVVLAPSVAAWLLWCALCWAWTGDPFVFWTTKGAWEEITLLDALTGGAKWSILPHVVLAGAALGAVVWERRRLPGAWLLFTGLYVLPALVTGLVGIGRYANECFPPFVAAGNVLARGRTAVRAAVLAAGGIGLVAYGVVVMRAELVP